MQEHDDEGPQDAVFEDGLDMESLVAGAIWEQIELSRRKGETPEEHGARIDPGFQRTYDGL